MKLRKIEKSNPNVIVVKIVFLLILLGFGLLLSKSVKSPVVLQNKKDMPRALLPLANLGSVKGIADYFKFDALKKQANNLANQVVGETGDIISESASEAGSVATKYVFETALKPVVNQINALPKDQQEILKKQICQ